MIEYISYKVWSNDVKQVQETAKAVKLEIVGDKRFQACVGVSAWFPKSALQLRDNGTTAEVKKWFLKKMDVWQERVLGMAEW